MSACNLTHRGWGFSDSGGSEERLGDSDAFAEPEDLDMLITAGVSVVACLLVPFLCWRHPQLTVPPGALQPHLAMLNACWTLVFIAGTLLSRSQRAIFQAQLLFLSDFFAVAMNVWDLVVLVDIFYVVQDPFRPSRSRWRYYVYVALVSLVVAGPVLVSEISEIRSMDSSDAAQLKLPGLEAADAVDDATWAAATAAALAPGNASRHDDGGADREDAAAAAAASAATLCQWEWAVSTAVALWNGLFSALCVFILLALRERLSIGLATSFASRRRVLRHATVYALSYVCQDLFGDVCSPTCSTGTSARCRGGTKTPRSAPSICSPSPRTAWSTSSCGRRSTSHRWCASGARAPPQAPCASAALRAAKTSARISASK